MSVTLECGRGEPEVFVFRATEEPKLSTPKMFGHGATCHELVVQTIDGPVKISIVYEVDSQNAWKTNNI